MSFALSASWLPNSNVCRIISKICSAIITHVIFWLCLLQVTDIDSPTGDHALIDIGKLVGLNPRTVTVRTKSRESTSADSQPIIIPSKFSYM